MINAVNKIHQNFTWYPTGSFHTCTPRVMDTDIDYLVYCPEDRLPIIDKILIDWYINGSGGKTGDFISYTNIDDMDYDNKDQKYNFIICLNLDFYDKSVLATDVCTRLNLLKKDDRITVFNAIRYGKLDLSPDFVIETNKVNFNV